MLLPLPVQNSIAGIASHRAWHRVTYLELIINKMIFKRIIYSITSILLLSLVSCTAPKEKEVEYNFPTIEINNKALKDAIIEYQRMILTESRDMIQRGDSVFIGIWGHQINDSITRYVIEPAVVEYYDIRLIAPFAVSRIDGHDVFITMQSGNAIFKEERDFDLSEETYRRLLKRYLPKKYREYQQKGMVYRLCIFEPENCYLTFLGDSLIDKTYQRGMARDRVWVNLNGRKVYL